MKIILTGAHGTGKTTVLKIIQEWLDIKPITEIARTFAKKGVSINEKGTLDTQKLIFEEYERIFKENDNYISDRGLTDVCAYTMAAFGVSSPGSDSFKFAELAAFQLKRIKELTADQIHIYFPIEFPIENDGVRSTDTYYQHLVDRNLRRVLRDGLKSYITLPKGLSPEERAKWIINELSHIHATS